jgi:hypothetical protein
MLFDAFGRIYGSNGLASVGGSPKGLSRVKFVWCGIVLAGIVFPVALVQYLTTCLASSLSVKSSLLFWYTTSAMVFLEDFGKFNNASVTTLTLSDCFFIVGFCLPYEFNR